MAKIVYLLVEDTESDALLVKIVLAGLPDAQFVHVPDGQEAIDYLLAKPPYNNRKEYPIPDVILLDIKMPRISGFDFLNWRQSAPLELRVIPVIIFSGSNMQEDVWRAYGLGANRYMVKPSDLKKYREQLEMMHNNWVRFTELPQQGGAPYGGG